MIYKRRFKKVRKTYRKGKSSFASKVKKVINKVSEKKKLYTLTSSTVSTTATFVALGNPAQGTSYTQRVGDTINPLRINVKLQITPADTWNTMRVLIIQWFDRNQTPTLGDILYNASYPMVSPYAYAERSSFRVLADRTKVMVDNTTAQSPVLHLRCKKPSRKIIFQTGSTSVADNLLYAILVSDSSGIPHPSVTMITDFTFTDS